MSDKSSEEENSGETVERAKYEELLQKMRILQKEREQFGVNFNNLRQEFVNYNQFHNDQKLRWQQEISSKCEEFEGLRQKFDMETHELRKLRNQLNEEKEINAHLTEQCSGMDILVKENEELRSVMESMKFDKDRLSETMNREIDQVKREYEEKIDSYEDRVKLLESKAANERMEVEKVGILQIENRKNLLRIKELEEEVSQVRKEKEDVLKSLKEDEVSNTQRYKLLMNNFRLLKSENQKMRTIKNDTDRKNVDLQKEVEELEGKNTELNKKVLHAKFELSKTRKRHSNEKSIRELREKNATSSYQYQISNLRERNERLRGDNNDLESENKRIISKLTRMEESFLEREKGYILKQTELSTQMTQRETEWSTKLDNLREKYEKDDIPKLENERRVVQSDLESVTEKLEHIKNHVMKEKEHLLDIERGKAVQSRKECDELLLKKGDLESQLSEAERSKGELADEMGSLKRMNAKMKLRIEYMDKELFQMHQLFHRKNDQRASEVGAKSKFENLLRVERKRVASLKNQLGRAREKYRNKATKYRSLMDVKNKEIEDLGVRARELEEIRYSEVAELKKEVARVKRENGSLRFRVVMAEKMNMGKADFSTSFGNFDLEEGEGEVDTKNKFQAELEELNREVNGLMSM